MHIWIEDNGGNRLGPGPITTAGNWQHTRLLDASGSWSFEMPAADERADLVRVKRIVRAWHHDGGQWRESGAGIIERRELAASPNGPMLRVSGSDILRELTYQRIEKLELRDEIQIHPSSAKVVTVDPASDYYHYEWYDLAVGDETTYGSMAGLMGFPQQFIYVASQRRFKATGWVIGATHNTTQSELQIQYFDTDSLGWADVAVAEDTTNDGDGRPFYKTGRIDWEMPANWGTESVAGDSPVYELRIGASSGLSAFDLYDLSIIYDAPTEQALDRIMAEAPAGWSLDPSGYTSIKPALLLGDNLVGNASFENLDSGTADDGATDTFTEWINFRTGAAYRVEATQADAHAGVQALKLVNDSGGNDPVCYQHVDVEAGVDYKFTFWTRNDGSTDPRMSAAFAFYDDDLSTDGSHLCTTTQLSNIQDTTLTGVTWQQYSFLYTTPPNRERVTLAFWGPTYGLVGYALVDDLDMRRYLGGDTYLTLENETILEALTRLAEHTGEHFVAGVAGRQVLWLRDDQRSTGVRLVNGADPLAAEGNDDLALITSLTEITDAYRLASRVYAHGGGTGDDRVSLKQTTRTAPDGYTLNRDEGYLERDAAVAELGRIDYYLNAPEVNPQATDDTQMGFAANALFDMAYHWLKRHSATDTHPTTGDVPKAYNVTVAKLNRIVLPGYYVTVRYREVIDDFVAVDIDDELCVLSSSVTIDDAGIRTASLQLGTVDYPIYSDDDVLANTVRRQSFYLSQTQAGQKVTSTGAGVVTGLNVRGGRVTGVSRRAGQTSTVTVDTGAGTGSATFVFRDGVMVSAS